MVALVLALCLGKLAGGSLTRLAGMPLRGWPMLAAALAVEVAGSFTTGRWYASGLALSAAFVLAFLARNRTAPGVALVGLGLLLNATVVAANGAMPVSRNAAATAGVDVAAVAAGADPRHEVSGVGTRLPVLGDVLALPLPGRPEIVSPGDVVVAAGLALLVITGMRRAPLRYRPGLVSAPHSVGSAQRRPRRRPAPRAS